MSKTMPTCLVFPALLPDSPRADVPGPGGRAGVEERTAPEEGEAVPREQQAENPEKVQRELPAGPRAAPGEETTQAAVGAAKRLPPSPTRGAGPTQDPWTGCVGNGR
ncbi:uncharacterized protein LOC114507029 [Phyllostomus discolor]|uniref:Uncharacterized protein LOC114507029 n=1 Tax=Phyllostomus discolor TaxID=89673 RepID=A0A6J2MS89_9CHIR|nr:uncharacterized protein LOC114507029 [Phyllostomus discolor]